MVKRILIGLLLFGIVLCVAYYITRFRILEPKKIQIKNNVPGNYMNLTEGFVYYRLEGSGKLGTVIFIHGGGVAGSYIWKKNYSDLIDQGYRILLYDLYDRGYSERLNKTNTLELFNSQFEELIDSLHISQPFHIVSLSMGSMVALSYANKYPEKIKSLTMISPAVLGGFQDRLIFHVPVIKDFIMTFYWSPRAVNNQRDEFYAPEENTEYFIKLREFKKYRGYINSNLTTWTNIQTLDLSNEIQALTVPTISIFGEHDPFVPPHTEKIFKQLNERIRTEVVGKAGHVPNYEQDEVVNNILIDFIQTTESSPLSPFNQR